MTTELTVTGMTCEGCAEIVETALEMASGVESATADHEANEAVIEGEADTEVLIDKVELAGYEAAT